MLQPDHYIRGENTLTEVIKRCRSSYELPQTAAIALVSFGPSPEIDPGRFLAAQISATAKASALKKAGIPFYGIEFNSETSPRDFQEKIETLNYDKGTAGVIIQLPVPTKFKETVVTIAKHKDIDSVSGQDARFSVCAAAQAVLRILTPFQKPTSTIAIVGGKGFVGNAIARALEASQAEHFILDKGDDIRQVRKASIVVSAVGQPEFLDDKHLTPNHNLVVDVGFSPVYRPNLQLLGDVSRSVYPWIRYITPVPGGVGPFQIAVLLERALEVITKQNIDGWTYSVSHDTNL